MAKDVIQKSPESLKSSRDNTELAEHTGKGRIRCNAENESRALLSVASLQLQKSIFRYICVFMATESLLKPRTSVR